MFTFVILAMIVILAACIILLGFRWEEAQAHMKACDAEQLAAYVEIMKGQLRTTGKPAGDDEFEPSFAPLMAAFALVALCALAGLNCTAIFFLFCFAACAYQAAEDIKALMVVQHAAGDTAYATA